MPGRRPPSFKHLWPVRQNATIVVECERRRTQRFTPSVSRQLGLRDQLPCTSCLRRTAVSRAATSDQAAGTPAPAERRASQKSSPLNGAAPTRCRASLVVRSQPNCHAATANLKTGMRDAVTLSHSTATAASACAAACAVTRVRMPNAFKDDAAVSLKRHKLGAPRLVASAATPTR